MKLQSLRKPSELQPLSCTAPGVSCSQYCLHFRLVRSSDTHDKVLRLNNDRDMVTFETSDSIGRLPAQKVRIEDQSSPGKGGENLKVLIFYLIA